MPAGHMFARQPRAGGVCLSLGLVGAIVLTNPRVTGSDPADATYCPESRSLPRNTRLNLSFTG